jgi:hypothetical protein
MPFPRLDRRTFLRAAGVAIALPFLDVMAPAGAAEAKKAMTQPRRMLLIGRPLGLYAPYFFPEKAGRDYVPSRYLSLLSAHREQFTVFSGVSHHYATGHFAECGLLTGVHPESIRGPSDIRNGISLDQEVASHVGGETRFASLVIGGGDVSWNRRGVRIPAEQRATQVFRQLFISGNADEQAREMQRIRDGQSILDDVRGQIKTLTGNVGTADRQRLDLYLTSVREAEQRLQQDEHWGTTPKPHVDYKPPTSDYGGAWLLQRTRQWYDIVQLALQTDLTRNRRRQTRPSRCLAPWPGPRQARTARAHRRSRAESPGGVPRQDEAEHRRRAYSPGPDRHLLRQQPGELIFSRQQQPPHPPRRRRLQAPGPPGLRPKQ